MKPDMYLPDDEGHGAPFLTYACHEVLWNPLVQHVTWCWASISCRLMTSLTRAVTPAQPRWQGSASSAAKCVLERVPV